MPREFDTPEETEEPDDSPEARVPDVGLDFGTQVEEAPDPRPADERLRMRHIVSHKLDIPLSALATMIESEQIDIAPPFQRRPRWSNKKRSRFIESLIMNVPVPPVFLGEDAPGQYVVLDGRQRLAAVYQYINNLYRLSGLEVWPELNRKKFAALAKIRSPINAHVTMDRSLTRRFIPAVVIAAESKGDVKYEVFDRLNTGGVYAEPMEVRNAVYRGPFNDLLHELSKVPDFRFLWSIPEDRAARRRSAIWQRMIDLELVLRFFALWDPNTFGGRLRNHLDRYMKGRSEEYRKDPTLVDSDRTRFTTAVANVRRVFGETAFRRIRPEEGDRSPVPSVTLADGVMRALAEYSTPWFTDEHCATVRNVIDDLCTSDDEYLKAITTGTNAKSAVKYRIERTLQCVRDALPLSAA